MTLRMQRRLLWLLADGLFAASLAILAFGLTRPLATAEISDAIEPAPRVPSARSSEAPATPPKSEPDREAMLHLASRDYRQMLFDPPEAPPPEAQPPPPLPAFRLVGTVLNPDRPLAMIADERGRITLKTIGDRIGEANNVTVITAIEADLIRLRHNDREATVKRQ